MIDLCQWRASIGLHHAAGSRALARTPGKRRLAGSAQQLAETVAIALASLLVAQCQLLFDSICHALLIRVLTFVAVFDCKLRQTGVSDVVCGGWFLSVSLLQALSGDLERSLSALAILLIMAGDVEQNPGPGTCIDDHINSTLACADVTYSMNPAVMVSSLLEIVSVVVCILLTSARINNRIGRPTIQVLVSGCSQTEVISTHSDSPGATLYQEVQRRSGIPVPLLTIMHGVNVIRRELSLGEQGIHHLSTIFLFVIGKGGGGTRLDQKPTMPELISLLGRTRHINIVEEIGVKCMMVGTILLDDQDGTIIPPIAQMCGNNVQCINMEILGRWLQGKGIPDCSWRGLLSVLRVHCRALAESVEEVLIADEAEQDMQQELSPPPTALLPLRLSSHPFSDRPQSSLPPPPHYPPLQPHSPEWYFNQYLVEFYSCPMDPVATWPPSSSKKFFNLAAISRVKVTTEELHKYMLSTLNKDVDTILQTKAPIEIEQLLDTESGIKHKCVLVEGAPGVGKTTLSWEVCKRWAEGNLFEQHSLLLLLRLRDKTVQNAVAIKDLILYPHEERVEAITQYLINTDGTNTLILLEGLDELPQDLLTRPSGSIFTRLLAGTDLPDATILVTSRPSATAQLWKKWKQRITRHVEILGFTEDNIATYVASILNPRQLPDFDTYLCTAPSIRQLMYIPLQSGIIVELYRMCRDSDKPLPTNKTALYKALVDTILTRHLANHPKYNNDDIDIDKFTDLPDDIYHTFMDITKLAYESVSRQQLTSEDHDKPVQHLGLMDVVAELFPNRRYITYSYNFLHLSIQEYLGAVYVSLMDVSTQEQLLGIMCSKKYLQNMAMFLAGITKFKHMNPELVKRALHSECTKEWDGTLRLSRYCLELAFESENASLLRGYSRYTYKLDKYSPLFDFTALGYFMARSTDKWALQLGDRGDYMQTTSGVDLLLHALHRHRGGSYTIDSIKCNHKETEIAQCLLVGLPSHTLPQVETLELCSKTLQPLPPCLPRVISIMNVLRDLTLRRATSTTLANTLQILATVFTNTLEGLDLTESQFSPPAMAALSALLEHSKSMAVLCLRGCGLTDDLAILLAIGLHHRLPKLRQVNLTGNNIGGRGSAALEECQKINIGLVYLELVSSDLDERSDKPSSSSLPSPSTLSLFHLIPPEIETHPTNELELDSGRSVTFIVTVKTIPGHDHTYTYQWQKNKTDISGATSSTYTISNIEKKDEATYCCIVSNDAGSVTSDPAELKLSTRSRYELALSFGHVKVRNALCLINGAAAVGKTCVRHLLYGLPPPLHHESTVFADCATAPQHHVTTASADSVHSFRPMQVVKLGMDEKGKPNFQWTQLNADRQMEQIIAAINKDDNQMEKPQSQESVSRGSAFQRPELPVSLLPARASMTNLGANDTEDSETIISAASISPSSGADSSGTSVTRNSASLGIQGPVLPRSQGQEDTNIDSMVNKLIESLAKSDGSSKDFLHVQHLYIIDSGGQSSFHELLSLFFSDIHVSISVIDLSKSLDEYPSDRLTRGGHEHRSTTTCALTQQEILLRTFRALQTQMHSTRLAQSKTSDVTCPCLVIVGTHRDGVGEKTKENIKDKNDKLRKLLTCYKPHLISCGGPEKNILFSVNAKNPKGEDIQAIENLKKKIAGIFTSLDEEQIPIKWYVLELCLRSYKVDILTYDQCLSTAKWLKMEDDLPDVLDHLMKLKTMFYFKCLKDLVFINPQPLLYRLSQLVEVSYWLDSKARCLTPADHRYLDGRVTVEYLNSKGFEDCLKDCSVLKTSEKDCTAGKISQYDDSMFTCAHLLELLLYKHVVAEISDDEYFMPFIVTKLETSMLYKDVKHDENIAPLAVHFPGGVAPAGVFCCLVASLLSRTYSPSGRESPWSFDDSTVYRNFFKFKFQDVNLYFSLTLLDAYTHFEAHVNLPPCFLHKVATTCATVKDEVEKCLKQVSEERKLRQYEFGIVCMPPDGGVFTTESPHYASLIFTGKDVVYNCSKECCEKRWKLITDRERCWDLNDCLAVIADHNQPSDQLDVPRGAKASFSVTATGDNLKYVWRWRSLLSTNFTDFDESDGRYCSITTDHVAPAVSDVEQRMLDKRPTLLELISFYEIDVAEGIGTKYTSVGIELLNDDRGDQVKSIEREKLKEAYEINLEILRRWVAQAGTLRKLMTVLNKHCRALYDRIWEALQTVAKQEIFTPNSYSKKAVLTISSVAKANEGTYHCVVSNAAGSVKSIPAQLTVLNPPKITGHPNNQLMVVPGTPAVFTVSVEAIGHDCKYQWQKSETRTTSCSDLNALESTLTISSVVKAHEGMYRCVVSNAAGSVTSDPAQLTVLTPPKVKTHPTSELMVVPENSATFTISVIAIPGHEHTYQWQKNERDIPGATSSTLTISSVVKANKGTYRCVATNAAGPVTSDPAQLTVLSLPTVTAQPTSDLIVVPGNSATFTVSVIAIPGHDQTYQWQKNETDIPGATLYIYAISSIAKAHEGTYRCVVTNAAGPVTSDPAQLTVLNPLTITIHPTEELMVVPGTSATFTVSVEAVPGHEHTYQWQKNKIDIPGATSSTYTISSVVKADEGMYRCVATNAAGSVTSDPAQHTVLTPPTIIAQPTNKLMVVPGNSATFTVSVIAIPGHKHNYQWQKNETDIPGATLYIYAISSIAKAHEGTYRCVVTNAAGPVTSDPAQLTVSPCHTSVVPIDDSDTSTVGPVPTKDAHLDAISASPSDQPPLLVLVKKTGESDLNFVEVEFAPRTYEALLRACCEELELEPSDVDMIRKLPNIRVHNDRAVKRLESRQQLEVVLKSLPK